MIFTYCLNFIKDLDSDYYLVILACLFPTVTFICRKILFLPTNEFMIEEVFLVLSITQASAFSKFIILSVSFSVGFIVLLIKIIYKIF